MKSIKNDFLTELSTKEKLNQLKTFFISFCMIIIAFGAKLVGNSYPSDDYFRIYNSENWYNQADRGRWFASILNSTIFNEGFFVLPYFSGILGLFFVAASGLLTAKTWGVKNQITVGIVILITTISPFWANNLFYSSNITVCIGAFLASLGFYLVSKRNLWRIGMFLFIISFGIYQTIFQSVLIVSITLFIINLIKVESEKELLTLVKKHSVFLIGVFGAFIVSQLISELIMLSNDIEILFGPYNHATRDISFLKTLNKIIYIFTSPSGFVGNFILKNVYFGIVTGLIIIIGLYSLAKEFINKDKIIRFKLIIVLVIALFFLAGVIQMPTFLGVLMPIRSCFHFSIVIAFVAVVSLGDLKVRIRNSILILIISYLFLSLGYISKFYDLVNRQTQSDIIRVNQMVNNIRQHPDFNYSNNSKPTFQIIGRNKFSVTSDYTKLLKNTSINNGSNVITPSHIEFQPFNADWSKYKIFEHFSDFRFNKITNERAELIYKKILDNKVDVGEYPERNSIIFIDDVIVLILDMDNN